MLFSQALIPCDTRGHIVHKRSNLNNDLKLTQSVKFVYNSYIEELCWYESKVMMTHFLIFESRLVRLFCEGWWVYTNSYCTTTFELGECSQQLCEKEPQFYRSRGSGSRKILCEMWKPKVRRQNEPMGINEIESPLHM